jgi:hypothetical protein
LRGHQRKEKSLADCRALSCSQPLLHALPIAPQLPAHLCHNTTAPGPIILELSRGRLTRNPRGKSVASAAGASRRPQQGSSRRMTAAVGFSRVSGLALHLNLPQQLLLHVNHTHTYLALANSSPQSTQNPSNSFPPRKPSKRPPPPPAPSCKTANEQAMIHPTGGVGCVKSTRPLANRRARWGGVEYRELRYALQSSQFLPLGPDDGLGCGRV